MKATPKAFCGYFFGFGGKICEENSVIFIRSDYINLLLESAHGSVEMVNRLKCLRRDTMLNKWICGTN